MLLPSGQVRRSDGRQMCEYILRRNIKVNQFTTQDIMANSVHPLSILQYTRLSIKFAFFLSRMKTSISLDVPRSFSVRVRWLT